MTCSGIAGALAVEEKGGNPELSFEIYNPIREKEKGGGRKNLLNL